MRLERRESPSRALQVAAPFVAVGATMLACAALVAWAGAPVGKVYLALLDGAAGSRFALSETLTRATPLILTGLSVAVAFRTRLYNIGAEGQLYLGALAAVAVGGAWGEGGLGLPPALRFPLMVAAGAAAGALWLLGPAIMKSWLAVDEVVSTLLLNFVALLLVSLLLDGPMKDPAAMGWPQSVTVLPEMELSRLLERTRVHTGLVWAVGLAGVTWAVQHFTTFGLASRAVGLNPRAAAFAGIPVRQVTLLTAILSGALAGLAGVGEVAGRAGYVTLDMSPGYGYSGIVIAMLAGLHPLGVVASAIFVAGVLVGADSMSRTVGVPNAIADVIVSVALLCMLVAGLLAQYRVRWRRT